MKLKNVNIIGLTVFAAYSAYFFNGLFTTVFGPTLTLLIQDYRINVLKAGLFISFISFGRMFSAAFSGVAVDKIGRKPVLFLGVLLTAAGLLGIGSSSVYWLALVFCVMCGMGHGMVNTSSSALMSDVYHDRLGSAMNRLNVFFGIGCLLGPLVSGFILGNSFSWRLVFVFQGIVGLLVAGMIIFLRFPDIVSKKQMQKSSGFNLLFSSTGLILLGIVMFIYTGSGHTINTWITKYLQEIVDLPVFIAAIAFAIYNFGLTAGRFVCSIISEKIGYYRIIMYSSIGALISVSAALFSRSGVIVAICLGLTGVFFGGLFPLATAIAGKMFPEKVGTVTGLMVMIAAAGSMTVPALAGAFSQVLGLNKGIQILIPLMVILLLVAIKLSNMGKKKALQA